MAASGSQESTQSEQKKDPLYDKYHDMLHKSDEHKKDRQSLFQEELWKNFARGDSRVDDVRAQIKVLKDSKMTFLLSSFPEKYLNPLQLAAFFYMEKAAQREIMEELVYLCPELIWRQRTGVYEGQTVLHTLIITEKCKSAKALLDLEAKQKEEYKQGRSLIQCGATGSDFDRTAMMGELPLSIAALTFQEEMVNLLLKYGAELWTTNSLGETVFHSLVQYAAYYPDTLEQVEQMIHYLHKKLKSKLKKMQAEPRDVWLIENKDGLTPLRKAASLAQPELFKLILSLEGVYRDLNTDDGIFDCHVYDMTELDPLAMAKRKAELKEALKKDESLRNGEVRLVQQTAKVPSASKIRAMVGQKDPSEIRSISVLEIIAETKHCKQLLDSDIIKELTRLKWNSYRFWFWTWGLLHFLFMVVLSVHAVYKARVAGDELQSVQPNTMEATFAITVAILSLTVPLVVLPLELWLVFRRDQPLNQRWFSNQNGFYRVLLVLFTLCLAADSVWFLATRSTYELYIQVLTLVLGWWFMTFFLRPLRKFSFFTVMLHKVVVGDIFRFGVVIVLMWMTFSVAIYAVYLAKSHPDPPVAFRDLPTSMLTMFQLLIGMAETGEVLADSPSRGLVIFLYVLYIFITYILMLNALIAMMSDTCSSVAKNKMQQWERERLCVVLFLEDLMVFDFMKFPCGYEDPVAMYDFSKKRPFTDNRQFMKVKSAKTGEKSHLALLDAFAKQISRKEYTLDFPLKHGKKKSKKFEATCSIHPLSGELPATLNMDAELSLQVTNIPVKPPTKCGFRPESRP